MDIKQATAMQQQQKASPTTTASAPTATTSSSKVVTNKTITPAANPVDLTQYNANREQQINNMYASKLDMNKAQLTNAYNQNMSDAQAAYDKISPEYQQRQNELSAEYERQRRNNNMQAANNGLNTGAGSQMALAQSSAYQSNSAGLKRSENEALNEANRNMLDIKTDYQNKISEATANNNYQLAAALLDEYGAQYDRTVNAAKQAAEYGNFALYASIYGQEAADQMQQSWSLQNPLLAYNLGKLTAQEYFNMTGKWPRGSGHGGGGSGGGGGNIYSGGGSGYDPDTSSSPLQTNPIDIGAAANSAYWNAQQGR